MKRVYLSQRPCHTECMAVELYAPRLILGGGEVSPIAKAIGLDRGTAASDVTTLGNVLDGGHTKHQKTLRMTTLTASGIMPSSDVVDHWLRAYESGVEDVGAVSHKFGGLNQKWAFFFPVGYGEATTSAKGNPVGALEFIETGFDMGETVGEAVTWAIALSGKGQRYMRGEHVVDVTNTSAAFSKSFSPSLQTAYDAGFRTMYLIAYLDGGAAYLGTGIVVTLDATKPGSPDQTQDFVVCGGGNRLSVVKWNQTIRDGGAEALLMTKSSVSSVIDIADIPDDATLRLGVVFGED